MCDSYSRGTNLSRDGALYERVIRHYADTMLVYMQMRFLYDLLCEGFITSHEDKEAKRFVRLLNKACR